MNKKYFILSTVVGGIMLILIIFTIQNLIPSEMNVTLTGTPADNFSEEQRSKFCGTGNAKSNDYVKEYKIPTDCTLPQAIVADPDGNIWFVESNTGNLAKFDPSTKRFTEYDNPLWPQGERSMMWGIDYAPDETIWFTDEKYNSVWKFNIQDEKYQRFSFPSEENSYPQRLEIHGSKLIINDFKGNKIVFSDYAQFGEKTPKFTSPDEKLYTYSLLSNNPDAVTADFTIEGENIWYTNWVLNGTGILTKVNQTEFELSIQNEEEDLTFEFFPLPANLNTPNGITADNNGNIWLVDSSSSLFFKFNSINENFTQYVTSNPHKSTYGNYTGEIKSPVSRPYWIDMNSSGKLVFNEQGSNSIGVFDPDTESLVEYSIPSKNPHWGDCGNVEDCGLSQVFDFVIDGDKIWFTEWSENNLGVVDTTILLPFEIHLGEDNILLRPGESKSLTFSISSISKNTLPSVSIVLSESFEFLDVQTNDATIENFLPDSFELINVTLHADDNLIPGKYKVLLGAATDQVSVSKFVTVIVKSSTVPLFESILLENKQIDP
ncbi:MAG: lyase [Nitrosopumilus sp.]